MTQAIRNQVMETGQVNTAKMTSLIKKCHLKLDNLGKVSSLCLLMISGMGLNTIQSLTCMIPGQIHSLRRDLQSTNAYTNSILPSQKMIILMNQYHNKIITSNLQNTISKKNMS